MSIDARARRRAGALLALPAATLLLALLFLPSSGVAVLSLTDYQFGMTGFDWIGAQNYQRMFADARFRQSLGNTGLYVAVVTPISIFAALWLAVLIEGQGRLRGLFRTVFFLPVTATLVAMATAWEVVLHPSFGMVNVALDAVGLDKRRFLSDPSTALPTLMFIGIWKMVGYNILLFIAGLSTIRPDLYEAAAIDGADRGWKRFGLVTWPMLAPVTLFVTVITLIRAVSEFETIAVLTQGGPNGATEMILYTLYQEAFRYFDIGLASAIAIFFLTVVAAASILNVVVFDRRRRA
ncbi:sugar ABC transporter permease [Jannaschia sp. S6380]|uniref:carbohydrate ABC transporter permease n=1 Tax=Jannaschia sp. S6380 TaxID=2926408 RepID=UPI001FF375B5|nr:sugar ABC transporter permease [Jannaschia sp. S6380]MCK0167699.1 sugar ABC transporter permease [Jannaschia sp. S6380]